MVSIANFDQCAQVVTQHKSGYNPGSKCVLTETPKEQSSTLRQQKDWVGGVRKIAIFANFGYCIYADIVSGWV